MAVMSFKKIDGFKSSKLAAQETSRDMEKRRPHPPKGEGGCELFSFMHETLLNPLVSANMVMLANF